MTEDESELMGAPEIPADAAAVDDRLDAETGAVIDALLSHAVVMRGSSRNLTRKVADRAEAIAREVGLSPSDRATVRKAALLRDVSRAGVSDTILTKSGPLTAGEFAEVQSRMVPEEDANDSESVRAAIEVAHHHHERVDGHGYPDGLKGDEIPMGSRVLAVAEAYETMLVETAWRPARTSDAALAEMEAGAGSQFDPAVVQALVRTTHGEEVSSRL